MYKAEVATTSGTQTKTLRVTSLYAKSTTRDYYVSDEYAISCGYNNIDELLENWGYNTIDEYFEECWYYLEYFQDLTEQGDRTKYSNSINTNGGFYIGRYEAGCGAQTGTTVRTSANSSATVSNIIASNGLPVCIQDQTPYSNITQAQAKGLAEKMYEDSSFTCTIPTGASWDRILGWLEETGDKTYEQINVMSNSFGNFMNVTFTINRGKYSTDNGQSYTSIDNSYTKPINNRVLLTTGAAPNRNVSNNIYDLAGNVSEWISEIDNSHMYSNDPRVAFCGSSYMFSADEDSLNWRNYYTSETNCSYHLGFRPTIYL